jgi:catechol 2,3-dioxygenase-like lactoylglutathione lyase family enzyme
MTDSSNLTIGFSHVGLSVSDLNASLKFFEAIGYKKVGGVESYPSLFLSDGSSLRSYQSHSIHPISRYLG